MELNKFDILLISFGAVALLLIRKFYFGDSISLDSLQIETSVHEELNRILIYVK